MKTAHDRAEGYFERLINWADYKIAKTLARKTASRKLQKDKKIRNILILCYGNIYRSPFLENYLRNVLMDKNITDINIQSAGFHTKTGRKSAGDYCELCNKWGVNLSAHRSRLVTPELLYWADLVFIMDGNNYKQVNRMDKNLKDKLIWTGSLSKLTPTEITDPYSKSLEKQLIIINQLAEAANSFCSLVRQVRD